MSRTEVTPELADFHPGSGHRHHCRKNLSSDAECTEDCANWLFAIAQDQERQVARVQAVVDMWEPSQPHPTQGCVPCALRDQVKIALSGIPHD